MLSFQTRIYPTSVANKVFLGLEVFVWVNCKVDLGYFCKEIDNYQPIHRSAESPPRLPYFRAQNPGFGHLGISIRKKRYTQSRYYGLYFC